MFKRRNHFDRGDIFSKLQIHFSNFPISKCDERTLYITITLQYELDKVSCDLIYLVDRPGTVGAISINEKYNDVVEFFLRNFQYQLLYSDEQQIAIDFTRTFEFKNCLNEFSKKYPKYINSKLVM